MALCMLVIVPVFLYALFLDDLLRHALDSQETAHSTAWDYTVLDYAKKGQQGLIWNTQHYARQMYCDHESGLDSFDTREQPRECQQHQSDKENHHHAVVGHACWLNPGAEQVTCTLNNLMLGESQRFQTRSSGVAGALGVSAHQSYMDEFGQGGLIGCSARLGVQNYLLGTTFLNDGFSKVKMARKQGEGDVHTSAQNGDLKNDAKGVEGNVYLLPWERLAIVTDTWALNSPPADVRPGTKSGDLYARVSHAYQRQQNPGYTQLERAADDFFQQATSNQLLVEGLRSADEPTMPNLAIKPHGEGADSPSEQLTQQGRSRSYFNSEWRDWEGNQNERTYQSRGNWYMGCAQAEQC
jgi:hypothetical protein